jgi:hypothetical protein
MAYAYLTALDLAKFNGSDQAIGLIEENLNAAPEFEMLPARTIPGTSFKTLVRTAYPTTSFRNTNEGVEPTKSTYVNKLFETYYYDGQMEVDKAIADADEQGADHALTLEADGHARAFMLKAGSQFYYGSGSTLGDAKGYPGASQFVDSSLLIDAGGTTSATGSSVYAVCASPKFFETLYGNNAVLSPGTWRMQTITRSSKEMTAWKNSLEGWCGLAFYSKYAVGRIWKLTADSGKGLTDTLLSQLLNAFPIGVKPTHLFMSRRSRRQLQVSRTVTLFGQGTGRPSQPLLAPVPTEYDGVPIIATDSILDTESLTVANN